MKHALAHIERCTRQLRDHAFIRSLKDPEPDLRRAVSFIPYGMFWVLTFQDIIKLNASMTRDATIRHFVDQHVKEDTGHHEWFLDDMDELFGAGQLDIRWLCSASNLPAREMAFALASEIYRIHHDHLRLVVIEALEAAASVFLGSISQFLRESGHIDRLKYFAPAHLQAERDHEIFTETGSSQVRSMELPQDLREYAQAMSDRIFAAFFRFGDFLLEQKRTPSI